MKTLFRLVRWLVGLSLLLVVGLAVHTIWFRPLRVDWFFERVFIEYAAEDPQLLSSLRLLPAWANWYGDELTDRSPAHARDLQAKVRRDLATLREYDRESLDE